MSILVVLATPQNDPAVPAICTRSEIQEMTSNLKTPKSHRMCWHTQRKRPRGLTYAFVGNEGAGKLQTDVENKGSIAQGLSGTSSAFTWPQMYANT